jgi:Pyruvate/2-oxoacid:ferredoxin oxidoreductase delta subunit
MADQQIEPDIYERLAEKMSNWPIRTPLSKEFRKILEALFTPEQAEILTVFNGPYVDQLTAEKIAKKIKRPLEEVKPILDEMARTQRIFSIERDNTRTYSLMPLIPGLFEFFFANYKRAEAEEKENLELFAKEFEKYYSKGFAAEIGSSTNPMMRVILDQKVVEDSTKKGKGKLIKVDETITEEVKHEILPFEQVKLFIENIRSFAVMDCACRTHMRIYNKGKPVNAYPIESVCMIFGTWANYCVQQGFAKALTKEEALETLKRAAKAGLVHTTQNMTEKITFICNCDRDCCVLLRGLTKFRNPNAVAKSNFIPEWSKDTCIFCEKCVDLCPMYAIQHHYGHEKDKTDEKIMINYDLCIGCGVCAYNCQKNAITMMKKFTNIPPEKPLDAAKQFVEGRIH